MREYSPDEFVSAHQYLHYVKCDTVLSDREYDEFCKKHNIEGSGGSDLASSYPDSIVALAYQLKTSKIKTPP